MMRRMRSSHLKWSNLLLIGVLVLLSFSLRPAYTHPAMSLEREKIGFIGDSITRSPARKSSTVEAEMKVLKNYIAINQGVSGSTSTDWLPGHILFEDALAVFRTQNVHTVSIMLGTNDARVDRATSPATYRRNMERIIENLLGSGVVHRVIVNYPPYTVPGSYGLWNADSDVRLKNYMVQLDAVVQERGVVQGDTKAYAYFRTHLHELADGVHPNAAGFEALGKLWAEAYKRMIADETAERRNAAVASLFVGRLNT